MWIQYFALSFQSLKIKFEIERVNTSSSLHHRNVITAIISSRHSSKTIYCHTKFKTTKWLIFSIEFDKKKYITFIECTLNYFVFATLNCTDSCWILKPWWSDYNKHCIKPVFQSLKVQIKCSGCLLCVRISLPAS